MRLSKLFFTTLRDDPADAEMPSHRLLLRAGYVRQLGAGIYSLLPLGFRVNTAGRAGHPRGDGPRSAARRWRCRSSTRPTSGGRAGRYQKIGPELVRFKDRGDRDMVLAMTHEEVVADPPARHRQELSPAPDAWSTTSRPSSATSRARGAA